MVIISNYGAGEAKDALGLLIGVVASTGSRHLDYRAAFDFVEGDVSASDGEVWS